MDTLTPLAYLTAGGSPARPVVPGSSYVNGAFTVYRPRLVMLVVDLDVSREEWAAGTPWTLELEEV